MKCTSFQHAVMLDELEAMYELMPAAVTMPQLRRVLLDATQDADASWSWCAHVCDHCEPGWRPARSIGMHLQHLQVVRHGGFAHACRCMSKRKVFGVQISVPRVLHALLCSPSTSVIIGYVSISCSGERPLVLTGYRSLRDNSCCLA